MGSEIKRRQRAAARAKRPKNTVRVWTWVAVAWGDRRNRFASAATSLKDVGIQRAAERANAFDPGDIVPVDVPLPPKRKKAGK